MHVVILTMPAHGHVNPLLPLAEQLVNGGDRVTFTATEEFADAVRATGASVLPLGSALAPPSSLFMAPADGRFVNREAAAAFFGALRDAAPDVMARIAAERPDALVYNAMLSLLSPTYRDLDVARVAFFTSYGFADGQAPFARLAAWGGDPAGFGQIAAAGDDRSSAPSWLDRSRPFAAEGLNIVPLPRSFQPGAAEFDDRYLFVGPSLRTREQADPSLLDRLDHDDGRPLVYVSLGTVVSNRPDFYRACFEAFAGSDWRVVAATGRSDPDALGPLPANVIARPAVPQLAVLARASVFVTHGGMNSTMEGLWHGVPLAVVPQQPEQALTGRRVAGLGLGRALDLGSLSGAEVRAAVEVVHADPGYRARIAPLQSEMRAAGGAPRAADAIRRYATAGGRRLAPVGAGARETGDVAGL